MARSLFITGASGFLGGHASQQLAADWQIIGTFHHHPIRLAGADTIFLDLADPNAIQTCLAATKPDAILHTAAIAKPHICQQNPAKSHAINVAGTIALATYAADQGIPFIFTSTDLVFDGTTPPYREGDRPSPISLYGQHKMLAEAEVARIYPQATVCRLPLMYGQPTRTATSFLQNFLSTIAANQPLHLFTDEFRTPAAVSDIVQGFALVLQQNITGLQHLGGPERLSRYDFGLKMVRAFGLSLETITPCEQAAVQLSVPRPKDVSLNSEQAFAWGYTPRPPIEALAAIALTTE